VPWTDKMPVPRKRWMQRNVDYAKSRVERYPFGAVTQGTRLRPHEVQEAIDCYFMRIPFGASEVTFWGFETAETRQRFINEFNAEAVS